jgi:hypothetical protein
MSHPQVPGQENVISENIPADIQENDAVNAADMVTENLNIDLPRSSTDAPAGFLASQSEASNFQPPLNSGIVTQHITWGII